MRKSSIYFSNVKVARYFNIGRRNPSQGSLSTVTKKSNVERGLKLDFRSKWNRALVRTEINQIGSPTIPKGWTLDLSIKFHSSGTQRGKSFYPHHKQDLRLIQFRFSTYILLCIQSTCISNFRADFFVLLGRQNMGGELSLSFWKTHHDD